MIALIASFLIATNATPVELVESCRRMLPSEVEITGRIMLRSRKGIVQKEFRYELARKAGQTRLKIDGEEYLAREGSIRGTDVTWSDLCLDYLWWDDFAFDAERNGESIHGKNCAVIIMKNGERAVRIWVDYETGALMEAEELKNGEGVRRLWGRVLKKFGERWMVSQLEVETYGSGHRTKITVEEMK